MPKKIQSYEIQERLGIGGMGIVHKATHIFRKEVVAIKSLNQQYCHDPHLRERFKREAAILHKLDHPNIVRVLDFIEEPDALHLAMEFVEGRTLDKIIGKEVGPIPASKALPIFMQILRAVEYAHSKRVIHRDLKPGNIIVTPNGKVKVTDFGIAKFAGDGGMTKTGTKMGTLYYMSPEQIRGEHIDEQSDIYSLGITLYEMLAGRLPFDRNSDTSEYKLMSQIVNEEVPSPREFYPGIPEWLVKLIDKAIAKRKEDRIKSVSEFITLINKETKNTDENNIDTEIKTINKPVPKPPQKPVKVPPLPIKTKNKRNITIIAGFILIVIIGLVLLKQSPNKTVINPNKRTEVNSNNSKKKDFFKGTLIKTLRGHRSGVNSVTYSPDRKYLASGSGYIRGGQIKIWNAVTGEEIKTLTEHRFAVNSVTYSPNGKYLASGSWKEIKIWNVVSGEEIKTLRGHRSGVNSVTYSPDGKYLASGSFDQTIKIWNAVTGDEIKTLHGHTGEGWNVGSVISVTYSPDGKYLASGSWDKTIKIWNAATGEEIKTLTGHTYVVNTVTYSPDGKYLASGSRDETIKIWNALTGKEMKTLHGHNGIVNSVNYSPDGKYLASASDDNTIKIWNAETGEEIKTLTGHTRDVKSVTYSPDGKYLASGSEDKTIKIWNAVTGNTK